MKVQKVTVGISAVPILSGFLACAVHAQEPAASAVCAADPVNAVAAAGIAAAAGGAIYAFRHRKRK